MKVFLDTNILLDLLLERDGFEASADLFDLCEKKSFSLSVSVLTMINAAFVYKKTVGQNLAIVNLKYLSSLLEVLPMNNEMLQTALLMSSKDFEDTFQAVCAREGQCDCIVTRNPKDFNIKKGLTKKPALPKIYTPLEFIKAFDL